MSFWGHGGGPRPGTGPTPTPGLPAGEGPPPAGELSAKELIDKVAGRIVKMRLGVAAVFFLESMKPLSFVGSQALIFLQPFVQAFLTVRNYERFALLMEDRNNVELLIQRVEALDEEMRRDEKQARDERRRRKREQRAAGRSGPEAGGGGGIPGDRSTPRGGGETSPGGRGESDE